MAEPHLPSLVIEGFRGFKKLELRKLGHVNLLVGKNGVGKSSVLDAVRLYASRASLETLKELLAERDADWDSHSPGCLSPLFYGRPDLAVPASGSRIPVIGLGEYGIGVMRGVLKTPRPGDPMPYAPTWIYEEDSPKWVPVLYLSHDGSYVRQAPFLEAPYPLRYTDSPDLPASVPVVHVGTAGVGSKVLGLWWDSVLVKGIESQINTALRQVVPSIDRVVFLVDKRQFVVKLRDADDPVPLRTLGEGVTRMLGICLAMVRAANGFVLIDEFESGLHYSVQTKAWEFVLKAARENNVQVFATTHSEDCVSAFASAAIADTETEGVVSRLVEVDGVLHVAQYDERLLGVVTSEMVEIR